MERGIDKAAVKAEIKELNTKIKELSKVATAGRAAQRSIDAASKKVDALKQKLAA